MQTDHFVSFNSGYIEQFAASYFHNFFTKTYKNSIVNNTLQYIYLLIGSLVFFPLNLFFGITSTGVYSCDTGKYQVNGQIQIQIQIPLLI